MDVHVQVADFHVSFQDLCPRFYHDPWLGSSYCGEHKPLTYFVPIQTPKPMLVCRRFLCWLHQPSGIALQTRNWRQFGPGTKAYPDSQLKSSITPKLAFPSPNYLLWNFVCSLIWESCHLAAYFWSLVLCQKKHSHRSCVFFSNVHLTMQFVIGDMWNVIHDS